MFIDSSIYTNEVHELDVIKSENRQYLKSARTVGRIKSNMLLLAPLNCEMSYAKVKFIDSIICLVTSAHIFKLLLIIMYGILELYAETYAAVMLMAAHPIQLIVYSQLEH